MSNHRDDVSYFDLPRPQAQGGFSEEVWGTKGEEIWARVFDEFRNGGVLRRRNIG